eukprot:Nitzschia sp. Nitz4//scaffold121_size67750//64051//65406//NITZ4_006079-RA/size67750-processed-gene-0.23-mRNA-1//-1//CDS//3329534384//9208//frame0
MSHQDSRCSEGQSEGSLSPKRLLAVLPISLSPPLTSLQDESEAVDKDQQERQQRRRSRRAARKIQSIARGFLARKSYFQKVQQRDRAMLEAYKVERRKMKEEELHRLKHQLAEIELQTSADIKAMKHEMKAEKKALKEKARRKFEKYIQKQEKSMEEERAASEAMNQLELVELEEEQRQLQASLKDIEEKTKAMASENAKLESTNNDISKLFHSLNDFAKGKMQGKKRLLAAQQKLSKVFKPKITADLKKGAAACSSETKLKELFQRSMYRVVQGVQTSDAYDQLLYEEVLGLLTKCEEELGNEVLPLNESTDFQHLDMAGSMRFDTSIENFGDSKNWTSVADLGQSQWNLSKNWNLSSNWDDAGNNSWSRDGAAFGESCNWDVKAGANQILGSGWESKNWASSNWETEEMNLAESLGNLDKKLNLTDIDCQSHDSWRTEHESLFTWNNNK